MAATTETGAEAVAATEGGVPSEVQTIVDALDDKRAVDIAVLDLREASESLDWFVIASGESTLQLQAMEESVRERMKAAGHLPRGVEGPSNRWVLIDYGTVIVHVMSPEAREFYDLEGLWADANRVEVVPS
ncbi:MAG TPA: ribosome silencing factor [Trueperaceae bacterium]